MQNPSSLNKTVKISNFSELIKCVTSNISKVPTNQFTARMLLDKCCLLGSLETFDDNAPSLQGDTTSNIYSRHQKTIYDIILEMSWDNFQ